MRNTETKKTLKTYMAIALALAVVMAGSTALIRMNATAGAETATITENSTVVASPFTEAVEKVHGSVVGVSNYTNYASMNSYGGLYGFGYGFGFGNGGSRGGEDSNRQVLQGTGSGVVVARGYVLTNYHVVENASTLEVTSGDDTYSATVAGYDESLDLAVLKVEDLPLEPVVLGDSDALKVGDWAICIGNPLSFTGTTTVGVISALNREVTSKSTDAYGRRTNNVNLMIQTDAAINAGNSGGGMFNVAGELVGVPSMKYTGSYYSTSTVEGIGMAIPINVAKPLIEEVLSGKTVTNGTSADSSKDSGSVAPEARPRMGVRVKTISASNSGAVAAGALPSGAYIDEVEKDSPAEKAGLKADDIVVEVDGNIISTSQEMVNALASKKAGDTVEIKYFRMEGDQSKWESYDDIEGDYHTVTVELAMLDEAHS